LPSWQQPENIDDNLRPAIDLLHSWDSKSLLAIIGLDNNQLAGTDAQRAADFQQQLDNNIAWLKKKEVMVRIIDLLDFTKFKQSPKWIVGFSDITVLHNHLNTMGIKPSMVLCPSLIPEPLLEAIESLKWLYLGSPYVTKLPLTL
jgi:muramoyltetrapeptide carboxypeptidase